MKNLRTFTLKLSKRWDWLKLQSEVHFQSIYYILKLQELSNMETTREDSITGMLGNWTTNHRFKGRILTWASYTAFAGFIMHQIHSTTEGELILNEAWLQMLRM